MAIRGLLFDKDGTLIDYTRTYVPINRAVAAYAAGGDRALARALLERNGQDPDTDRIAPGSVLAAGSIGDIAAAFAVQLGGRAPSDLAAGIERLFCERGAAAVLIAGVADTLRALRRRGLRLGVASNDSHGGVIASLGGRGVLELFDYVGACGPGLAGKPDPRMALQFCAAVGLPPRAVAVIGDAVHDLAMARAAGAGLAIAVLSGTGTRADLAPLADLVVDSVNDLPSLAVLDG